MAKGQYLNPHQQGIVNRYYEHLDSITAQKLGELVSDLYLAAGTAKAEKLWETAGRVLTKTSANQAEVAKILAEHNLEGLARIVNQIAAGKPGTAPAIKPPAPAPPSTAPAAPAPAIPIDPSVPGLPGMPGLPGAPSPEVLKQAIKAFKKRLKLTRLDEESKLGRSPMTSGAKSSVIAIIPPNQYPRAVWDALVKEGRLKNAGQGFYELIES